MIPIAIFRFLLAVAITTFAGWCVFTFVRLARGAAKTLAEMRRTVAAALLALAVACVVVAQKRGGGDDTNRVEQVEGVNGMPRSGGETNATFVVTGLCFTAIAKSTNSVTVAVEWPTNFFAEGTTLDLFGKTDLIADEWLWLCETNVVAGETGFVAEIPVLPPPSGTNVPATAFFLARDRAWCAFSMRDADGDGIPDAYEFHNGTHPYVADAALAPRLTVGDGGDFATIASALAASTNYSIISLAPSVYAEPTPIMLPSHPVMLVCEDGYAVVEGESAWGGVFAMNSSQTNHALFRNIRVVLKAKSGYLAGFWLGSSVSLFGDGAAATFENVHVRALYPGVLHFGWLFYRDSAGASVLRGCTMNAAGSARALGVFECNAASNILGGCVFLNMPTNAIEGVPVARQIQRDGEAVVTVEAPGEHHGLSWAGYTLDGSYSDTTDSDGDGLSDYAEVFTYDTDPWLADSDGDGISDGDEVLDATDPRNLNSHVCHLDIVITNTIEYSCMTNYVYLCDDAAGETNTVFACDGIGGATNMTLAADCGELRVFAWRDMDRNGVFDADYDVVQTGAEIGFSAVVSRKFTFGDIDSDGVSDLQERADGTDPYSRLSLRMSRNVTFYNDDPGAAATNYYCISTSPDASATDWTLIDSSRKTVSASLNATNGCLYAFVMRDVNGNGFYDEGIDVLYRQQFAKNSSEFVVTIKDADGDGVPDGDEILEGTDPMDRQSYCYSPAVCITRIFATTNRLTCAATFGTNEVLSAAVTTNSAFYADFGHLTTAAGEYVKLWFWDDANSNAVRDVGEAYSAVDVKPHGHETFLRENLQMGMSFDADRDCMSDGWEIANGLCPTNAADAYIDSDGDGLLNLLEFEYGFDPFVADATNTAIAAFSRSIDSRLVGRDPAVALDLFNNYITNGYAGVFERNTNCWSYGIDLSCASPWNCDPDNPARKGNLTPVTAISKRHVIFASHWRPGMPVGTQYLFVSAGGSVYTNRFVNYKYATMPGSDAEYTNHDICIGLLEDELPVDIRPAKFLPDDFADYLGSGHALPFITIEQNERAHVVDIAELTTAANRYNLIGPLISKSYLREPFGKHFISGDSSSPRLLVLGNEVVLFGTVWKAGGAGCNATLFKQEIQYTMNFLCPGYDIQEVDLSAFSRLEYRGGAEK